MTQVKAYAPGIYARSEDLVQATRDLDRGRTTPEAVEMQRTEDMRSFLGVQREAGMDYLSDGLLDWQDILRPFDTEVEGLKPGPLTRFLNTNTFFRAPVVTISRLQLVEPLSEPYFQIADLPRGEWVATLPSPHTVAALSAGEAALSPVSVAEEILRPQIEWLAVQGCAFVVLQESALFGADSVSGLEEAIEAINSPLQIALQLPFGDAGDLIEKLVDLKVEAIGVDFYSTDLAALPRPFPKTLLAGVVDARNSLLEDPAEVAGFGQRLLQEVERDLHLVPNGDLQFVPERIAREKVLRLGAAARILREES